MWIDYGKRCRRGGVADHCGAGSIQGLLQQIITVGTYAGDWVKAAIPDMDGLLAEVDALLDTVAGLSALPLPLSLFS